MIIYCLFTLNHLSISNTSSQEAAAGHFAPPHSQEYPLVLFKQPPSPIWQGPAKLLTWGRGYAAVLSPTGPLWIPARCVKPHHELAPRTSGSITGVSSIDNPDDSSWLASTGE